MQTEQLLCKSGMTDTEHSTTSGSNEEVSLIRHNLKTLRLVLFRFSVLVTLPKNCWLRVLGSVVIQLYAGEFTPSVDRA